MTSLRGFVAASVTMTLLVTTMLSMASAQTVIDVITPEGTVLPTTMVTTPRVGGKAVTEAAVDLVEQSCIFAEDSMFFRRLAYLETRDGTVARTYGQEGYYGGIWRVNSAMFRATQANTPQLQTKYAQIRDVFGIDWLSTTWQDLQKPLYSLLAAGLYTSQQSAIPFSLEDQGEYVHHYYDDTNSAFNYTMSAQHVPVCEELQQVDLAFLLDATTSHDDFQRMLSFVRQVMDSPLTVTGGQLRVSVYQFGGQGTDGHPTLQKNVEPTTYSSQQQLQSLIAHLGQATVPSTSLDIGQAVSTVIHDSFSGSRARPLSTKMIILLTDKTSSSDYNMQSAGHTAQSQGVTLMGVGVGNAVSGQQLSDLVTAPLCRHRLMLPSFRELRDVVQRVQRTICHEPMIATGMVHCPIEECRNVAFPLLSNLTTLIANVSCDNGRVVVATRTPEPGKGFADFSGIVDGGEDGATATYVTIHDFTSPFLYANLFGVEGTAPGCVATLTTVNGIVGEPTEETCNDHHKYPNVNPCQTPGRDSSRFPYEPDQSMFIQCDLKDKMYLTHCPPGEPFYSRECEMCVGGPDSPAVLGCRQTVEQPHNTPYCGLDHNPCTRDNIVQGHYYFACPINETYYLQCNIWGHAFVKQCPEHEVWREQSLTCEYMNTGYNPCGTPGVRYYPYPPDPHYFVDCGTDNVPYIKSCQLDLVWNPHVDTCDYPPKTTLSSYFTHLTNLVTSPHTNTNNNHHYGGSTPNPVSGLLTQNYAPPCTHEHINANQFYWPYQGHPHQYIQCDQWGDAFVRSCQAGFFYDKISFTCVDGDVIVDNLVPGGSVVG